MNEPRRTRGLIGRQKCGEAEIGTRNAETGQDLLTGAGAGLAQTVTGRTTAATPRQQTRHTGSAKRCLLSTGPLSGTGTHVHLIHGTSTRDRFQLDTVGLEGVWPDNDGIVTSVVYQSISSAFFGRSDELGTLDGAQRRTCEGDLQGVLIGGEAGIGKTTLLQEFLARAKGAGAVGALGNCLEVGAEGLPHAPLVTALSRLHRVLGAKLERAAEGYEEQLSSLLPDLGRPGRTADGTYGRARLFESTARFFDRLAADRPVVLAIEDVHWSDRSTAN